MSKPTSVLSKEKVQSRPSFDKAALNSRKLKEVFMLVLKQLALESNSNKLEIFKLLLFYQFLIDSKTCLIVFRQSKDWLEIRT